MRPLLSITTTNAKYEYDITRPHLQMQQPRPTVNRTTQRASLNMRREAGRFEMNSVRRRSDMGFKGVVDRANSEADQGRQTALEKTGNYVELGNQLAKFAQGANIPDALWSQSMQHSQGELVLVPVSSVDIHYVPANLMTEYVPGQMQANWNISPSAMLEFVPGSFRLNFQEYASIKIEYLGGFNYVPPSADPNFETTI